MKKLALALVCLVSVAFFASCEPEITNPEPSIAVMTGENFVFDGQTVDLNTYYSVGFRAASNSQTQKELSSFTVTAKIFDMEGNELFSNDKTTIISGTEFVYQNDSLIFVPTAKELVGKALITATVTDVDGKTNSKDINLLINQPAQELLVSTLRWYRLGNDIQGLEDYGMKWQGNYVRDTYAKLVPMEGVTLYTFTAEDWANTTTDVEKAALFLNAVEHMTPSSEYFNVNVTVQNMTYNDVIGTVMPDGTCHLMNITKSTATYVGAQGTEIVITGEAK